MTRRRNKRHKVLARDGYACAACGKDTSAPEDTGWQRGRKDAAQVDHATPLWLGGTDALKNQRVLCAPCHKAKTKREAAQRAKIKRTRAKFKAHRAKMRGKL
jgi:5-methylcytosine-specific restriction enzyme A